MTRYVVLALTLCAACGGTSPTPLDEPVRIAGDGAGAGIITTRLTSPLALTFGTTPTVVLESLQPPAGHDLSFTPGRTIFGLAHGDFATLGAASIALGDLHVGGAALPAGGIDLRDLTLVLAHPLRAGVTRARPDVLAVAGTATFELRWKLVLEDGSLYPLGPVEVGPFELHAAARRAADDTASMELLLLCPDACAEVPGIFQLGETAVDVTLPVALEAR